MEYKEYLKKKKGIEDKPKFNVNELLASMAQPITTPFGGIMNYLGATRENVANWLSKPWLSVGPRREGEQERLNYLAEMTAGMMPYEITPEMAVMGSLRGIKTMKLTPTQNLQARVAVKDLKTGEVFTGPTHADIVSGRGLTPGQGGIEWSAGYEVGGKFYKGEKEALRAMGTLKTPTPDKVFPNWEKSGIKTPIYNSIGLEKFDPKNPPKDLTPFALAAIKDKQGNIWFERQPLTHDQVLYGLEASGIDVYGYKGGWVIKNRFITDTHEATLYREKIAKEVKSAMPEGGIKKVFWGERQENVYTPVKYIPRKGHRELVINPDGQVVLYADPVYKQYPQDLMRTVFRDVENLISPLEENVFIRVTNNPKDYEFLKQGKHRGSLNRNIQEWEKPAEEGGLSVAKKPEIPTKYAYYVKGRVIGEGADGEPLLDLTTATPASKLFSYNELYKDFTARQKEKINSLGLSPKDILALHNAEIKFDLPKPPPPPGGGGGIVSPAGPLPWRTNE